MIALIVWLMVDGMQIQGASNAGVRTVFVANGIHRKDLPECAEPGFEGQLTSLCEKLDVSAQPTYYLPSFVW
eukprot:160157-Prorocentrum_minimum.AAC.1